jgi:ankyrin repeat protein
MISADKEIEELRLIFSDLVNYESDDPLASIDPFLYRSPEGDTCLHIAALRGDYRAAVLLIDGGVSVNSIGDMGNTPLHYAAAEGHQEIFDLLVSRGADKEIRNEFGKVAGAI